MSRPDWRSAAAYEDKHDLDPPGFAYEFLRRNPKFVRDQKKLERALARHALTTQMRSAFARRWGIRFRERSTRREKSTNPLDGRGSAECHWHWHDTCRPCAC
jgi:hypothetical protein